MTVKHVKVTLKRKMAPYRKDHMLLIGAKTFIVRGTILIRLISNGHLIQIIKKKSLLFMLVTNNHKLIIADNDNDIDTADDDNDDDDDDQ